MEKWKDEPMVLQWLGTLPLQEVKTKTIYKELLAPCTPSDYLNKVWKTNLDDKVMQKTFSHLWYNGIDAKKNCFKWLVLLHKVPFKFKNSNVAMCDICRVLENVYHIFFYYLYSNEI